MLVCIIGCGKNRPPKVGASTTCTVVVVRHTEDKRVHSRGATGRSSTQQNDEMTAHLDWDQNIRTWVVAADTYGAFEIVCASSSATINANDNVERVRG